MVLPQGGCPFWQAAVLMSKCGVAPDAQQAEYNAGVVHGFLALCLIEETVVVYRSMWRMRT